MRRKDRGCGGEYECEYLLKKRFKVGEFGRSQVLQAEKKKGEIQQVGRRARESLSLVRQQNLGSSFRVSEDADRCRSWV